MLRPVSERELLMWLASISFLRDPEAGGTDWLADGGAGGCQASKKKRSKQGLVFFFYFITILLLILFLLML